MLMTLLLLGAPWLQQRFEQHQAVAHIAVLGGTVRYDYQYDRRGKYRSTDPVALRAWLRARVGGEWFGHVVRVSLSGTRTTDDDLRWLATCSRIRSVELNDTKVTGSGFVHFKTFRQLEYVDLQRTPLTKHGLSRLRKLGTVHSLNLWGIEPTPDLFRELQRFRRLTFLEWDIEWGDRRSFANRLKKQFPQLFIYSP